MMKKTNFFILLIVFLFCIWPVSSSAEQKNKGEGKYEFVKGKGVEICEVYYKNLMLFHPRDIACERKFDSEFKDFRKPNWVEWNLTENKDLAVKMKKFLRRGDQFANIPDLDNEKLYSRSVITDSSYFIGDKMNFSRGDINNDGRLENVIVYNEGRCMDMHFFSRLLLVLNEEKTLIDVKKTDPLLQNPPSGKDIRSRIASRDYNLYDVFSYKEKTYFDRWDGVGTFCNDTLSVYELLQNKTKEVCKYKSLYRCK